MRRLLIAAALIALIAPDLRAQEKNLWLGTWKINLAKSKYSPGPPPKSAVRKWEDRGAGVVIVTTEGTNAQGEPTLSMITFKYDGLEYPTAQIGAKSIQTYAVRRIDARTVELTFKNNGKVMTTGRETISTDGKTMVLEQKGTNAQGQAVDNYVVLERQ